MVSDISGRSTAAFCQLSSRRVWIAFPWRLLFGPLNQRIQLCFGTVSTPFMTALKCANSAVASNFRGCITSYAGSALSTFLSLACPSTVGVLSFPGELIVRHAATNDLLHDSGEAVGAAPDLSAHCADVTGSRASRGAISSAGLYIDVKKPFALEKQNLQNKANPISGHSTASPLVPALRNAILVLAKRQGTKLWI